MTWISANDFLASLSRARTEVAARDEIQKERIANLHEQAEKYEAAGNKFFLEGWEREKRADEAMR